MSGAIVERVIRYVVTSIVDDTEAVEVTMIDQGEDRMLAEVKTAFYLRDRLPVGETFPGPAVVLQRDSTTVVPPGSTALSDEAGNLIITVGDSP